MYIYIYIHKYIYTTLEKPAKQTHSLFVTRTQYSFSVSQKHKKEVERGLLGTFFLPFRNEPGKTDLYTLGFSVCLSCARKHFGSRVY